MVARSTSCQKFVCTGLLVLLSECNVNRDQPLEIERVNDILGDKRNKSKMQHTLMLNISSSYDSYGVVKNLSIFVVVLNNHIRNWHEKPSTTGRWEMPYFLNIRIKVHFHTVCPGGHSWSIGKSESWVKNEKRDLREKLGKEPAGQ